MAKFFRWSIVFSMLLLLSSLIVPFFIGAGCKKSFKFVKKNKWKKLMWNMNHIFIYSSCPQKIDQFVNDTKFNV